MTAPDAEKRIRRIEDRLEIQDLAVRYCIAIDDSDYAGMLPMYTEKAGVGEMTGRQEVVDQLRTIRSTYGRTIRSLRRFTTQSMNHEPAWRGRDRAAETLRRPINGEEANHG